MKIAMLIILLVFISACTTKGAEDVGGSGGSAELKLVRLEDGTKCAVLVGYYKAALSCDWSKP